MQVASLTAYATVFVASACGRMPSKGRGAKQLYDLVDTERRRNGGAP